MSWKKYGGINKLDKLNNISVNTIVTDQFTLKNFYVGDWDICGALRVKNDTFLMKDLYIAGDISCQGDVTIDGSLNVLNTNIIGNVFVSENAFVKENIYMDFSGGTVLHGENRKFGFNTLTPQATIDISSDLVRTIDIHTTTASNKNVVARNVFNQGMTVNVEPMRSYIDFYVDNSMNLAAENFNGRLVYEQGGNFTIDVSNIVKFKPRVIFSQDLSKGFVGDERIIFYGNPLADVPYIPTIYGDNTFKTGTPAYLVSSDNSSNAFFRIGTEKGSGITLGGGYFPNNKIMGVLALTDASNTKYPTMNIISGNLTNNLKTSIAVNKYNVSTLNGANRYAMDINGPVKLDHQELIVAADISFQVFKTGFFGNIGYAIGSPVSNNTSPYTQFFLKTEDGGYTWTQSRIVDSSRNPNPNSLEESPQYFTAIYAISASDILIAGSNRYFFRSTNGGITWSTIPFGVNDAINTTSLFLSNQGLQFERLIVGIGPSEGATNSGKIINSPTGGNISLITTLYIDASLSAVNAIHGSGLDTVIVGVGGIIPYRTYISMVLNPVFGTRVATTSTFYDVKVFNDGVNNHVVAVGDGSIWYAHDLSWNGTAYTVTWSQAPSFSGVLRSVQVLDTMRAIAVGDNGLIMYSIDGFATWTTVTNIDNNSLVTGVNLSTVAILNANDFVVSGVKQDRTKMFNLYAPYFLNRPNNHVLETSGNIVMSGDLQINDAGQILTTNNTNFNILPTVAQEINIGNTAVGGNTNVKANLDVTLNITGRQNMQLYGDASFNSRFYLGGDASLNSKLYVVGDASLNSKLFVGGDVSLNSKLYVVKDASLNSKLFVGGDVSLNSKLYVVKDASLNASLFVGGDVSLNSKLYVVKDASLNSKLSVGGDTSLNSNLYVVGKTIISDLSAQNADFTGIVRGNTFDSRPGSSLTIGGTNAGNITIRTSTGATNTLTLGDAGSNTVILGNLTLPGSVTSTNVNNLEIKNKTILLNDEATGTNDSKFSGIQIRDDGVDNKGYFLTNGRSDGYLFKSSQSTNRVNLDVSGLYLSNGLTQGFVILKQTSPLDISADYTITTGLVNISDIQQLDTSLNRRVERDVANTTVNTQTVSTKLLTGGLYVGKLVDTFITNSQMDIAGNAFISKLGLGTSSVNANYTLEVNNNARIVNNLDVSGSISVENNINMNKDGIIVQW
jgi:hypothetical protein